MIADLRRCAPYRSFIDRADLISLESRVARTSDITKVTSTNGPCNHRHPTARTIMGLIQSHLTTNSAGTSAIVLIANIVRFIRMNLHATRPNRHAYLEVFSWVSWDYSTYL